MTLKAFALSLLQSRKFWLTLIPMISSVVLYTRHAISADQLANAMTAGFGILVYAISHEDNGAKQNIMASGDILAVSNTSPPKAP